MFGRGQKLLWAVPMRIALVALPGAQTLVAQVSEWPPPKTPWGDPDLQGLWPSDMLGYSPLQRTPAFGNRAVLNNEEFAAVVAFVGRQRQIDQEEDVDREAPLAVGKPIPHVQRRRSGLQGRSEMSAPSYWASERGDPNQTVHSWRYGE